MKAIMVRVPGSPEALEYAEVSTPCAGPGELLLKVAAAGVSFGDVQMRRGQYPHMPPLPFVTGCEAAGEVVAAGAGVEADWVGRRALVVMPGGCAAQYVVCPAPMATPLPDAVGFETAVAVGVNYLTAYFLLRRSISVAAGDWVVIHSAAGGVGSALVQLARFDGLRVIGLAGSAPKCHFVETLGAEAVLQSGSGPLGERVRALTGSAGASVVLNSVGGQTLLDDLKMIGPFGQLVLYGMAEGPPTPEFVAAFLQSFGLSPALRLMSLEAVAASNPLAMGQALRELVDLVVTGQNAPHVHATLPLAQAAEAHRLLESRRVMGKVVLTA